MAAEVGDRQHVTLGEAPEDHEGHGRHFPARSRRMTSGEGAIPAGGRQVFARRIAAPGGTPRRPPIVFLHEGLGAITMWRDFPERLCAAAGRGGLVLDRLGHGRAEPLDGPVRGGRSPGYHDAEVASLLDALDHCDIAEAVLFGHSDGGTIALLAAADAPERVAGCITEAAHVFVEPVTLQGIRDARAAYEAPGSRLRAGLVRHHGEARADRVFYGWADAWLAPAFAGWNITARLDRVRCPVLAIQGVDDQYGTPAQVEAIVAGVCGPAEALLLDGSGHAPHLDSAEAVIAAACRALPGP